MKKTILPVFAAACWISLSEFVRNEFLFKTLWVDHYASMGLAFPSEPINGALWGVWSLVFAALIFVLAKKFTMTETTIFSWVMGFVLMWIVLGNLDVLPFNLLWYAVPLSLLEVFLAVVIIKKLTASA